MIPLLHHPGESARTQLISECAKAYGADIEDVRYLQSPYRICPIGAHIDHQKGPVSAIAVTQGVNVAFLPGIGNTTQIHSEGYGAGEFTIDDCSRPKGNWLDYARGAVFTLSTRFEISRGLRMCIQGHLSEAGISSSAAIGLAYLTALAEVNDLTLSASDLIEFDRIIENDFLGLKNGVLDQSAIALAQRNKLTIIDCSTNTHHYETQTQPFHFLAVYSGVKEPLVNSSKFNNRVEECFKAGAELEKLTTGREISGAPLGHYAEEVWRSELDNLTEVSRKRSTHFFTESNRVRQGAKYWREGNVTAFGDLMKASCLSSIQNYETGSPEMIRLFEMLAASDGVYGARFSGAGFRGCAVALVEPDAIEQILNKIQLDFCSAFPHLADKMWAIHSQASDGLRLT